MVAQPIEDFLNPTFVEQTANELAQSGFLTDEHSFAPYRETIGTHWKAIESALHEAGHPVELMAGFLKHPAAGFAYYIYDKNRFRDGNMAERAVTAWLDARYR